MTISLDFVETEVNDTIQYSFALSDTASNFIAVTSCCAESQTEANKLIALDSDNAYKAYYNRK